MDDITFCIDECQEFNCERNPENIMHPELPHSFAHLQQTEYCLLVRQVPKEKIEVVRCRDCKYCYSFITARSADGRTELMEYRCKDFNASVMPDEYCSRGERRDE